MFVGGGKAADERCVLRAFKKIAARIVRRAFMRPRCPNISPLVALPAGRMPRAPLLEAPKQPQ